MNKPSPDKDAITALYAAMFALENEAIKPEKVYSLDLLMWKLWRAIPEEERREMFNLIWDQAWNFGEALQDKIAMLPEIAAHVCNDTEYIEDLLYDNWPDDIKGIEIARETLQNWRNAGAGWLADIYEPQVNERAAKLNGPDNDPKLMEAA